MSSGIILLENWAFLATGDRRSNWFWFPDEIAGHTVTPRVSASKEKSFAIIGSNFWWFILNRNLTKKDIYGVLWLILEVIVKLVS